MCFMHVPVHIKCSEYVPKAIKGSDYVSSHLWSPVPFTVSQIARVNKNVYLQKTEAEQKNDEVLSTDNKI